MRMLYEYFDDFYNSTDLDEKENIKQEFFKCLWASKCKIKKINKSVSFKISDKLDEDVSALFKPYQNMAYLKHHKRINNISGIDCIRVCVNNLFVKYCHKELGYSKEYYENMNYPRRLYNQVYYKKLNLSIDEIKNKLYKCSKILQEQKNKSVLSKMDISWNQFKIKIEEYISKLFERYIPVSEYEEKNNVMELTVNTDFWSEDNYIVGFVCKSLQGYLKNYYKEYFNVPRHNNKKYDNCVVCGKLYELNKKSTTQKYCKNCLKDVQRIQWKMSKQKNRKMSNDQNYKK